MMYDDVIEHHGILNQKWGKRNGPPYPLKGGDYSKDELDAVISERKKSRYNLYNKKHFDQVVREDEKLVTLSWNKDRTKNTDMFYATHTKNDIHQYNTLFNKKMPQDILDENGNKIGTGEFYKYKITNTISNSIKVSSEDSSSDAFISLYNSSRDFKNFVTDPDRMQSLFVNSKYKYHGYVEAKEALERIRKSEVASEKDLRKAYRIFNYVLPNDGSGNERVAKDVTTQRARFFNALQKNGYSALLDTNDAIYGGFHAESPIIIFDMSSIVDTYVKRVTTLDKAVSEVHFATHSAKYL